MNVPHQLPLHPLHQQPQQQQLDRHSFNNQHDDYQSHENQQSDENRTEHGNNNDRNEESQQQNNTLDDRQFTDAELYQHEKQYQQQNEQELSDQQHLHEQQYQSEHEQQNDDDEDNDDRTADLIDLEQQQHYHHAALSAHNSNSSDDNDDYNSSSISDFSGISSFSNNISLSDRISKNSRDYTDADHEQEEDEQREERAPSTAASRKTATKLHSASKSRKSRKAAESAALAASNVAPNQVRSIKRISRPQSKVRPRRPHSRSIKKIQQQSALSEAAAKQQKKLRTSSSKQGNKSESIGRLLDATIKSAVEELLAEANSTSYAANESPEKKGKSINSDVNNCLLLALAFDAAQHQLPSDDELSSKTEQIQFKQLREKQQPILQQQQQDKLQILQQELYQQHQLQRLQHEKYSDYHVSDQSADEDSNIINIDDALLIPLPLSPIPSNYNSRQSSRPATTKQIVIVGFTANTAAAAAVSARKDISRKQSLSGYNSISRPAQLDINKENNINEHSISSTPNRRNSINAALQNIHNIRNHSSNSGDSNRINCSAHDSDIATTIQTTQQLLSLLEATMHMYSSNCDYERARATQRLLHEWQGRVNNERSKVLFVTQQEETKQWLWQAERERRQLGEKWQQMYQQHKTTSTVEIQRMHATHTAAIAQHNSTVNNATFISASSSSLSQNIFSGSEISSFTGSFSNSTTYPNNTATKAFNNRRGAQMKQWLHLKQQEQHYAKLQEFETAARMQKRAEQLMQQQQEKQQQLLLQQQLQDAFQNSCSNSIDSDCNNRTDNSNSNKTLLRLNQRHQQDKQHMATKIQSEFLALSEQYELLVARLKQQQEEQKTVLMRRHVQQQINVQTNTNVESGSNGGNDRNSNQASSNSSRQLSTVGGVRPPSSGGSVMSKARHLNASKVYGVSINSDCSSIIGSSSSSNKDKRRTLTSSSSLPPIKNSKGKTAVAALTSEAAVTASIRRYQTIKAKSSAISSQNKR